MENMIVSPWKAKAREGKSGGQAPATATSEEDAFASPNHSPVMSDRSFGWTDAASPPDSEIGRGSGAYLPSLTSALKLLSGPSSSGVESISSESVGPESVIQDCVVPPESVAPESIRPDSVMPESVMPTPKSADLKSFLKPSLYDPASRPPSAGHRQPVRFAGVPSPSASTGAENGPRRPLTPGIRPVRHTPPAYSVPPDSSPFALSEVHPLAPAVSERHPEEHPVLAPVVSEDIPPVDAAPSPLLPQPIAVPSRSIFSGDGPGLRSEWDAGKPRRGHFPQMETGNGRLAQPSGASVRSGGTSGW